MRVEEKIDNKIIDDMKNILSNATGRRLIYYFISMKPKINFIVGNDRATSFNLGQTSIIEAIEKIVKKSGRENIFRMEDEYASFIRSYDEEYEKQDKVDRGVEDGN